MRSAPRDNAMQAQPADGMQQAQPADGMLLDVPGQADALAADMAALGNPHLGKTSNEEVTNTGLAGVSQELANITRQMRNTLVRLAALRRGHLPPKQEKRERAQRAARADLKVDAKTHTLVSEEIRSMKSVHNYMLDTMGVVEDHSRQLKQLYASSSLVNDLAAVVTEREAKLASTFAGVRQADANCANHSHAANNAAVRAEAAATAAKKWCDKAQEAERATASLEETAKAHSENAAAVAPDLQTVTATVANLEVRFKELQRGYKQLLNKVSWLPLLCNQTEKLLTHFQESGAEIEFLPLGTMFDTDRPASDFGDMVHYDNLLKRTLPPDPDHNEQEREQSAPMEMDDDEPNTGVGGPSAPQRKRTTTELLRELKRFALDIPESFNKELEERLSEQPRNTREQVGSGGGGTPSPPNPDTGARRGGSVLPPKFSGEDGADPKEALRKFELWAEWNQLSKQTCAA
jgi:hypothetical protein